MKALPIYALAAAALLGARPAAAQTHALKVNLLSPLVKTGSFFYEQRLNDASSLQLGALFTHWGSGDTQLNGFALTPEYRRYLSADKTALAGFYVAPFLRYQQLGLSTATTDDFGTPYTAKATLHTLGGGVVVGHQWVFARRVTLDTFLGPSYNANLVKVGLSESGQSVDGDAGSFQGFSLRTGITLGFAF